MPYRYSEGTAWRPAKRTVECQPQYANLLTSFCDDRATPRGGEGAAAALAHDPVKPMPSTLGNYLNDMKRCKASLRTVPSQASEALQRKNDERVFLSGERRQKQLARSVSCDSSFASARGKPGTVVSSVANAESDREDNYGFSTKRGVSGKWTKSASRIDLLHHSGSGGHSATRDGFDVLSSGSFGGGSNGSLATSRTVNALVTPRSEQRPEASARFEQMVAHMHSANPAQRKQFETFKTRGENSLGIFSEPVSPAGGTPRPRRAA